MPQISILSDRMPAMRWGLVAEAIALCPGANVVARDVPTCDLVEAVGLWHPDIVILGAPETLARGSEFAELLASPGKTRRIITLFDQERVGQVREWRRSVSVVEHLSITSLCATIRGCQ